MMSVVNHWLPYRMILSGNSFEREENPRSSNNASTLLRRSDMEELSNGVQYVTVGCLFLGEVQFCNSTMSKCPQRWYLTS